MATRVHRRVLAGAAALLAAAALAAPTASASRVETVDIPSTLGNVDARLARFNATTTLQARVLLPDGYDDAPGADWPVLYLLHGVGDTSITWLHPTHGNAQVRAAGFPGIIVMPDGGRGYYTDAWTGGRREGLNWERYELDEMLPAIEARYRIRPGRGNHAIGGLSMGGYGAVLLASQLPSYFGTAISMSGLLDLENTGTETLVPFFSSFSYLRTWGPYRGPYAQAHDPMRLLQNLEHTRLYVTSGNGVPDPRLPFDLTQRLFGGPSEWAAKLDAQRFTRAARGAGLSVTWRRHNGLHSWPYWSRALQEVVAWGPVDRSGPESTGGRTSFTYRTMAPHGNAWGLGFRFAAPPRALLRLTRSGQTLTATGRGLLTITPGAADADASGGGHAAGCAFTATLPFERTLPSGC